MSDNILSPFWCCFLNVRVANSLYGSFGKDRNDGYYNKCHKHIQIDFDSHTDETIRPVFKELLEKKLIFPKRIRGMGKKTLKQFYEWCGYEELK